MPPLFRRRRLYRAEQIAVPFIVDFRVTVRTTPDCHGVPFNRADLDRLRTSAMGSFKTPAVEMCHG